MNRFVPEQSGFRPGSVQDNGQNTTWVPPPVPRPPSYTPLPHLTPSYSPWTPGSPPPAPSPSSAFYGFSPGGYPVGSWPGAGFYHQNPTWRSWRPTLHAPPHLQPAPPRSTPTTNNQTYPLAPPPKITYTPVVLRPPPPSEPAPEVPPPPSSPPPLPLPLNVNTSPPSPKVGNSSQLDGDKKDGHSDMAQATPKKKANVRELVKEVSNRKRKEPIKSISAKTKIGFACGGSRRGRNLAKRNARKKSMILSYKNSAECSSCASRRPGHIEHSEIASSIPLIDVVPGLARLNKAQQEAGRKFPEDLLVATSKLREKLNQSPYESHEQPSMTEKVNKKSPIVHACRAKKRSAASIMTPKPNGHIEYSEISSSAPLRDIVPKLVRLNKAKRKAQQEAEEIVVTSKPRGVNEHLSAKMPRDLPPFESQELGNSCPTTSTRFFPRVPEEALIANNDEASNESTRAQLGKKNEKAGSKDYQATLQMISPLFSMATSYCCDTDSAESDMGAKLDSYLVETDISPITQKIIQKYGDITANSWCPVMIRASLLGVISKIVQGLQIPLKHLKPNDLKAYFAAARFAQESGLSVSWLLQRLDEIVAEIKRIKTLKDLEDEKRMKEDLVESTQRGMRLLEDQMDKLIVDIREQDSVVVLDHLKEEDLKKSIQNVAPKVKYFRNKCILDDLF